MSKKEKVSKILFIIVLILILAAFAACICYINYSSKENKPKEDNKQTVIEVKDYLSYKINSNSIEDFDLLFLKLENKRENKVYSPLSIKYALEMLEEASEGETKKQISDIIGTYIGKKYTNSNNLSLANALFIKDSYKNNIKESYKETLSNKYNAQVLYDSFKTTTNVNKWVSDKTFNLIDSLFDDVSDKDFILVNALAIDMEWVNEFKHQHEDYYIRYPHEDFHVIVGSLVNGYDSIDFKNTTERVKAVGIGATANRYDIVSDLGEENIRSTIKKEYQDWLDAGTCTGWGYTFPDADTYVEQFISEIKTGYNQISSSTDFRFYTDEEVKVFAKDLKTYDGITLEYIGIMPKEEKLSSYIKNINADKINTLINNLKPIELSSFKDGVVTKIQSYIPLFKYDYELNLKEDLNLLGITDVFDSSKSDLSNITDDKAYISEAKHKANIEFSNEGIKAAAATEMGGKGGGDCYFEHLYTVPVEEIDLTFDNSYMYIIRDKDSGEVWFVGTVYKPTEWTSNKKY